MATPQEVQQMKAQIAAANQAAADAQAKLLAVQQDAEAEVKRIREQVREQAAAPDQAPPMDVGKLAETFASALASAGVGASVPRRDDGAASGAKKVGRTMPLYRGEGSDQYLRFERKFKAWAQFNCLYYA